MTILRSCGRVNLVNSKSGDEARQAWRIADGIEVGSERPSCCLPVKAVGGVCSVEVPLCEIIKELVALGEMGYGFVAAGTLHLIQDA